MKQQFKLGIFSIILSCQLAVPCYAEITQAAAIENVQSFLGRKIEFQLGENTSTSEIEGRGKRCFRLINREGGIQAAVDVDSGMVCRFQVYKQKPNAPKGEKIPLEEATKKAQIFIKERAKAPTEGLFFCEPRSEEFDGRAFYTFTWEKRVDYYVYPTRATLTLDASTGEVVEYRWFEHIVKRQNLVPAISKEQALEVGKKHIALLPGWKLQEARLAITPSNPEGLWWMLRIRGSVVVLDDSYRGKFSADSVASISVNADSGTLNFANSNEVPGAQRVQLRPPVVMPREAFVADEWASWSSDLKTSVFTTFRWVDFGSDEANAKVRRDYKADIRPPYNTVLVLQREDKLQAIMASPGGEFVAPSLHSNGNLIAFTSGICTVYVLDIAKGTLGECNSWPRTYREMPSWHPKEKRLAMVGNHSPSDGVGNEDADIFVAEISNNLSVLPVKSQMCVAHWPGKDKLPVFSPDGEWIVFAHQDPFVRAKDTPEPKWWLCRTRANGSSKFHPERLVELADNPERLSWTPDSAKVLVAYQRMFVFGEQMIPNTPFELIGVETKKRETLTFPVLHDPDLPTGKPLVMCAATLTPDGQKIAFSSWRWSGSAQDAAAGCLYTIKLDGTDLKRMTSPEDITLPNYPFPQKDITALNAYEKLAPKPNSNR